MIQVEQGLNAIGRLVYGFLQCFVFLVKEIGQRAQKCVFSLKIVVEGTFGGAGSINDFLYGGIVVALLIEQLPCGGYNLTWAFYSAIVATN